MGAEPIVSVDALGDAIYHVHDRTRSSTRRSAPNLWPIAGIGYIDVKIIECFEFMRAVMEGRPSDPSFRDGYQIARIFDATIASGLSQKWERVSDFWSDTEARLLHKAWAR